MIYSILIYRGKKVIHYEELVPTGEIRSALIAFSPRAGDSKDQRLRLVMGMISAITGMFSMLSGADFSNRFESFSTPEYRLDYSETISGYKFVVVSSPNPSANRAEVRADFDRLYQLLFVPLVIRNPLFNPRDYSGDLRDSNCQVFLSELRNHFRSLTKTNEEPVGSLRPPTLLTNQSLI